MTINNIFKSISKSILTKVKVKIDALENRVGGAEKSLTDLESSLDAAKNYTLFTNDLSTNVLSSLNTTPLTLKSDSVYLNKGKYIFYCDPMNVTINTSAYQVVITANIGSISTYLADKAFWGSDERTVGDIGGQSVITIDTSGTYNISFKLSTSGNEKTVTITKWQVINMGYFRV